MKKRALLLFLLSPMLLCGCSSESQTLAKNLDDTITSLVYTVSSLDWVDSGIVESLNAPLTKEPENIYMLDPEATQAPNSSTQAEENMTNASSAARSSYNYPTSLSGSLAKREAMSQKTVSKISQTTPRAMTLTASYSTEDIQLSSEVVKTKINELIERRGSLIMYVNALYNGNIRLSSDNVTAINAYINIIKDNTSYLKNNRGMVINQLTHANSLKRSNSFSPLINAYIIRTSEAINTRISKIEASNLAIDSIIEILDANITSTPWQGSKIGDATQNQNIEEKIITENKNANNATNNEINTPLLPNNQELLQNSSEILQNYQNAQTAPQLSSTARTSRNDEPTLYENQAANQQQISENNISDKNNELLENRKKEENIMQNPFSLTDCCDKNAETAQNERFEEKGEIANLIGADKQLENDKSKNNDKVRNTDNIVNVPYNEYISSSYDSQDR